MKPNLSVSLRQGMLAVSMLLSTFVPMAIEKRLSATLSALAKLIT